MSKSKIRLEYVVLVLAAGVLCLGPAYATAQTTEPPGTGVTNPPPPEEVDEDDAGTPSTANPPAYIGELMTVTELKQEQVDQMRASGLGWGEIRIATQLAEQMAANSKGTLTFDATLAQVLAARAEGKGFGEIAAANNLKVSQLVGNQKADDSPKGAAAKSGGKTSATATAAKEKKPGFFARVGRFLGLGRSADKPVKPGTVEKPQSSAQALQTNKPERPVQLERGVRPEKVERPQRPDRPERPDKVERPSRPERPERGPHRG
jgi:hypothetical protein